MDIEFYRTINQTTTSRWQKKIYKKFFFYIQIPLEPPKITAVKFEPCWEFGVRWRHPSHLEGDSWNFLLYTWRTDDLVEGGEEQYPRGTAEKVLYYVLQEVLTISRAFERVLAGCKGWFVFSRPLREEGGYFRSIWKLHLLTTAIWSAVTMGYFGGNMWYQGNEKKTLELAKKYGGRGFLRKKILSTFERIWLLLINLQLLLCSWYSFFINSKN